MPFFLPSRLIDFEYFSTNGPEDPQYTEMAKPYRKDMDFAFFASNFGFSRKEYEELTPREINFLYKAWENRAVSESYLLYNAVFTAVYNVNRPKRKRALKLWRKAKVRKADMETVQENLRIIREVEVSEGTDWVKKIYAANGMKYPGKKG